MVNDGQTSSITNAVDSLQFGDTITLPSGVTGTVSKKTNTNIYFEFDNGGKADAKLDGSVGSVILNRINKGEIVVSRNGAPLPQGIGAASAGLLERLNVDFHKTWQPIKL